MIPSNPKTSSEYEDIIPDENMSITHRIKSADTIIVNPSKTALSTDELARELSKMYNSLESKTTGIHLFGLKYGHLLINENIREIIQKAKINESYIQEVNKMIRLYSAIKNNIAGVCFYEDVKNLLNPKVVNKAASKFELSYLRAMRTKPFLLLAGISGTGKSRIVRQMAFDSCPLNAATNDWRLPSLRTDATTPGNYCLVEVKPNWHDSSELIGYESQIGKPHYVVTPFIRFLAKAMVYEQQRVPFFVCLDEMNLAPVEQYFAEFLSILESRKVVAGKITSEPIIGKEIFASPQYERQLKDDLFGLQVKKVSDEAGNQVYDGELSDAELSVYERLKNDGLRIPSNLIVIGTVNMDETTHQFSRKVIDRAMTIEMNLPAVNPFMDFYNTANDQRYTDSPLSGALFLPSIVGAADAITELAKNNTGKTDWLKQEIATILTELNEALEDTPFKIAYRVQNELILFFYELWNEYRSAYWRDILTESVDQILMMKVLPRVEGDSDLLEEPLKRLADFCVPYIKSKAKVEEMTMRLERSQYTSFWP